MFSLLRGDQLSVDEASKVLDHPLRAKQTALVTWSESSTSTDALVGLNALALPRLPRNS